jgi:uncharacterized protein YbaA (DUF1428 family)
MAKLACRVWMEHGALEYRECSGDDLDSNFGVPFGKLAKLKPSETVIFAWVVYKSRAHRDKVNAKIMKDPRIINMMEREKKPFDDKRMTFGGFNVLVEA